MLLLVLGSSTLISSYHYGLRLDGKRYSVGESGLTQAIANNYTYDDQGKVTLEAGPYAHHRLHLRQRREQAHPHRHECGNGQRYHVGQWGECPADYLGCPRTVTIRSLNFV